MKQTNKQTNINKYNYFAWNICILLLVANVPSSCGNSSQITAKHMLMPFMVDSVNAAPILSPSMKLCKPSPKMIIHATGETKCKFSKLCE